MIYSNGVASLLPDPQALPMEGTKVVAFAGDVWGKEVKKPERKEKKCFSSKGKPGKTSIYVYPQIRTLGGLGKVCLQLSLIYLGPVELSCPCRLLCCPLASPEKGPGRDGGPALPSSLISTATPASVLSPAPSPAAPWMSVEPVGGSSSLPAIPASDLAPALPPVQVSTGPVGGPPPSRPSPSCLCESMSSVLSWCSVSTSLVSHLSLKQRSNSFWFPEKIIIAPASPVSSSIKIKILSF